MVILETAASRTAGTAGKRGSQGSGLVKNLSLVFVCASCSGHVLESESARDLRAEKAVGHALTNNSICTVDLSKFSVDTGRFESTSFTTSPLLLSKKEKRERRRRRRRRRREDKILMVPGDALLESYAPRWRPSILYIHGRFPQRSDQIRRFTYFGNVRDVKDPRSKHTCYGSLRTDLQWRVLKRWLVISRASCSLYPAELATICRRGQS